MKNFSHKILTWVASSALLVSCSDFDEINIDPNAASAEQVRPEYFINGSIIGAQQNPHIAERIFVLYWKAAGRLDSDGYLVSGGYNDGFNTDYYASLNSWITSANNAVKLVDERIASKGANNVEDIEKNLKQVARIWRVYLLSEATDNFGPFPISKADGENPAYSSVEEIYKFMLSELKSASQEMIDGVSPAENISKEDPAYKYDFAKWKKYANSMRMRLAMRLSEVAPDVAKTHFEEAAQQGYISELGENFQVQEKPGWDPLTGVMSREWNDQLLSTTLNNLYIGLGGITSQEQLASNATALPYIKPQDYIGVKYDKHFPVKTNAPAAGYWFDGLHHTIDPRAYAAFPIPGDLDNPEFNKYPSWATHVVTGTKRKLIDEADKKSTLKEIDAKFTWNAMWYGNWGDKADLNELYGWPGCYPRLANKFRNSSAKRIFFASWESYFLMAEAATRGWATPMSAKDAYEKGIQESFKYWGVDAYYANYIASEAYNRLGTSVKWEHTTEPTSVTMNYVDGYTNASATITYNYPTNNLYKNGSVKNDALTKIITQKFIAQLPWLPLETWNDQRRLGLPFFDNPAVELPLTNLPALTSSNYMQSKVEFFPQRLPYPSNLKSNSPKTYQQAISLLGGEDKVSTPLWWAKKP